MIPTPATLKLPDTVKAHPSFKDFIQFHTENKEIMREIISELRRGKAAGRKKMSVKAIINFLRWNMYVQSGKDFKINDKYTGIYTHIIAYNFSDFRSLIDLRKFTAK